MEEFRVKLREVGRPETPVPLPSSMFFIYDTPTVSVSHPFHQAPLNEYFPEYTSGADADKGAQYILDQFLALKLKHRTQAVTLWPSYVNLLYSHTYSCVTKSSLARTSLAMTVYPKSTTWLLYNT